MTDTLHSSVKELAPNLTTQFPRSPRATLAGFIIAGRTLDKCRAELAGTLGEYHFDCPLDNVFFDFTGISAKDFRKMIATGASDEEIAAWIEERTQHLDKRAIIQWNNDYRCKRLCEMPIELQEFLEGYIPENIPSNRIVYYWFDVYDIEEKRI